MKQRVITGACYAFCIFACLVLKVLVPNGYGAYGFDLMLYLFTLIGTFEFLRAVKEVATSQKIICYAFAVVAEPLFLTLGVMSVLYAAGLAAMLCAALFVFDHARCTLAGTAYSLVCSLYVTGLMLFSVAINHMGAYSITAMLILFISVPLCDCFALFFGMAFGKKLPYKLAPHVSPNKTIVGGFGGLVGGLLGAVVSYFLSPVIGGEVVPWVVFVSGVLAALFGQIGDLFESAVKRACGIKDMGKFLPGHGGVLDRVDSMLTAAVILFILFSIV